MPYGKRTKQNRTRSNKTTRYTARRRTSVRRGTGRVPRGVSTSKILRNKWENPMAYSKSAKFHYADNGFTAFTDTDFGNQVLQVYRGNGPYDPDYSGVGVQPYGWDQYDGLYGYYQCYGSKITITCYPTTQDFSALKVFVFPFYGTSPDYTDPSDLKTTPFCKWKILNDEGTANARRCKITNYMSTSKFLKTSPRDLGVKSAFSGLPATQWYWLVAFNSADSQEEVTCKYDVDITYWCKLSRQENIDES